MRSFVLATAAAIVLAAVGAVVAARGATDVSWATRQFTFDVILANATAPGFGRVKFRQPDDPPKIVFLDASVRGLAPNHSYLLQRAVDVTLDGNCTSTAWLTLGKGLVPQAITTDSTGAGHEELFRDLSALATGAQFDIHFRLIDAETSAPVLTSGCYRFAVRG